MTERAAVAAGSPFSWINYADGNPADEPNPAPAAPAAGTVKPLHPLRRWLSQLGGDSLRGRYLYLAAGFALLLLAAAFLGAHFVSGARDRSQTNTSDRQQLRAELRALTDSFWRAQTELEAYLLAPDATQAQTMRSTLAGMQARIAALSARTATTGAVRGEDLQALNASVAALHAATERVVHLRMSTEELYPAVPTMLTYMVPAAQRFDSLARLALDEAEAMAHAPGQHQAYRAFAQARHDWMQMISAFRNWVTSRFGVFADPTLTLTAQLHNIDLYYERVLADLDAIAALGRAGGLEFQQTESLPQMRTVAATWRRHLNDVVKIYTSDRWRTDVPLLRDTIHPLNNRIWTQLRTIEQRIDAHSLADLGELAGTADRLSASLWFVTALALVLVAVGYGLFEYAVRRPIARVAAALKAEARGDAGASVPPAHTAEMHDLIAAFAHMRAEVHSRQQRLETVLHHAAEGIVTFDRAGLIQSFNRAAEQLFGYAEAEVVGKEITLLLPPAKHAKHKDYLAYFVRSEIERLIGREGEVTGRHKDGTHFPAALKVSAITLDGKPFYTGLLADISERKAMVAHLKQMAEHDGLTGLYNRGYFQAELERVVERARRGQQTASLLYIDLDNFKYVNDTLGHAAGDRLLIAVANILQRRARKSDLIARLGGDEFIVLLYNVTPDLAATVAESFRTQLAQHVLQDGGERVDIGCSIGVCLIDTTAESSAAALAQADIACHIAKRAGRNRVHLFVAKDAANVASMSLDMGWSRRIRDAIAHGRFALACQPIVDVASGGIESYEILIRMLDENEQLVLPGGFLPAAERFGLAVDIDKWVISNAIETLVAQRKHVPNLRYSINLSGRTLVDLQVLDLITAKLAETGLDAAALTFEVTETTAIADMAAAEKFLRHLQRIGCRTALDDFGSGVSSFAYLQDLPIDTIKIDGRFVRNIATNPVDRAMVKAMNEIAHALGKRTVAEFVENEAALTVLREYGVDFAQGFHLGRPDVVLPCAAIGQHGDNPGVCALPGAG